MQQSLFEWEADLDCWIRLAESTPNTGTLQCLLKKAHDLYMEILAAADI